MISTSKIAHGIGIVGLIAAGYLQIPFKKYIIIAVSTSIIQYIALLLVGIFFGHAYNSIGIYLKNYSIAVAITTIIGIIFILLFRYWRNNKIHDTK